MPAPDSSPPPPERPRIPCPPIIREKVRQFAEHVEAYQAGDFSEAQLRIDYINPMLESLGWDVNNTQGHAEAYRDVVYEDAIKVKGTTKAPDYGFYIGGRAAGGGRKFFLEAKRPSVPVRLDHKAAFQLRRYAYSAQLPLSVLTNFKDFIAYDTRFKPSPKDSATAAAVLTIKFDEYPERWDEIASVFSRAAILRGAFDKFAQGKRKKGIEPLGESFLKDIEEWRKLLAQNIAEHNPRLTVEELNFAVQRTIDRILFLRICEDRGIEHAHTLLGVTSGDNIYARLAQIFRSADDRYNSGIFHFPAAHKKPDPDRAEPPDDLTLDLTISDKPLAYIIKGLYDTGRLFSSYAFAVIPPEILGQVYERFLGKVITLKKDHSVKIEEKPEVRKAGGVYYTPAYIVEYIVKNTVGKLLEAKTPDDAAKITVLDPASGSGSFLIGAYQYLLDWHLRWYIDNNPDSHCKGKNPPLMRIQTRSFGDEPDAPLPPLTKRNGLLDYRLTTQKRKEILLNSIYGVDIDAQAVEVTKLSLLLKVLEGETQESIAAQLKFVHQRALPDLGRNIKCGNSLIDTDIIGTDAWNELREEERRRINPFDYGRAFAPVFKGKDKGFDAVIGNPPYIRVSNLDEAVRPLLYAAYNLNHRFDIYVAFVERGVALLSGEGTLGFILPNKFFTANYGHPTRDFLTKRRLVRAIVDFGDKQVFEGATTYTCLLILDNRKNPAIDYALADIAPTNDGVVIGSHINVAFSGLSAEPWSFVSPSAAAMIERFRRLPKLGSLYDIQHGLQTGLDAFFLLELVDDDNGATVVVKSELERNPFPIERTAVRTVVKGLVDLGRFAIRNDRKRVFFPYAASSRGVMPVMEATISKFQPLAWAYIKRHRKILEARGTTTWFAFRRRNYDLREDLPRILVPSIATRSSFSYDPVGKTHFVGSGGGGGGGYGLNRLPGCTVDDRITLGILNSRLIDWLIKQTNSRFGRGYYSFNRQFIEPIPIALWKNQIV